MCSEILLLSCSVKWNSIYWTFGIIHVEEFHSEVALEFLYIYIIFDAIQPFEDLLQMLCSSGIHSIQFIPLKRKHET
jgi:hypothetical protein